MAHTCYLIVFIPRIINLLANATCYIKMATSEPEAHFHGWVVKTFQASLTDERRKKNKTEYAYNYRSFVFNSGSGIGVFASLSCFSAHPSEWLAIRIRPPSSCPSGCKSTAQEGRRLRRTGACSIHGDHTWATRKPRRDRCYGCLGHSRQWWVIGTTEWMLPIHFQKTFISRTIIQSLHCHQLPFSIIKM